MIHSFKNVIIASGLGLMSLTAASHAQVYYFEEDPNVHKAELAVRAGDLIKAAQYYSRAARSVSGEERLLPVLNTLCIVEYANGNFEAAIEACTKAVKTDRKYWQAYLNRGNAKRALGDMDGAVSDYNKAKKLNPKTALVNEALAGLLKETGKNYAEVH
ncbi:tetratricopeptide repeat protein [Kordiimonas pumila]|uniref:Tetratricopeptide repeat protein n=1 Tax=Kordiimonas pumila TaxID=2161677 RepID=A0ABV7D1Y5_9PROT|nr:tetratricopeptide repeat protein [Kordiimonas pumila]